MREIKKFPENTDRFKELVLYISKKCASDGNFDSLKLSKILFFSDFLAYGNSGRPITGAEYVKMAKGPAPRRIREIKQEMVDEGLLVLQTLPLRKWDRPVQRREANLAGFSGADIALVDAVIDVLKEKDSEAASDLTHDLPCWTMSELNETIPYEMIFLSQEAPTPADIESGQAAARELGLIERVA